MMIRRTVPLQITDLGDDEVEIRWMTGERARDGHILVPEGAVLDGYRANPIVLWQHNPEYPVGTNENLTVDRAGLRSRCRFAPPGTTQKADETRRLVKGAIVRTGSIGFAILDGKPIDPRNPRAGLRATRWELFECSFVSVPADPGAVVIARGADFYRRQAELALLTTHAAVDDFLMRQREKRALQATRDWSLEARRFEAQRLRRVPR